MSPRTWKSSSTLSSSRALRSRPARSIWPLGFSGGGGEQVERRQLVIVAQRQAGLAGQAPLALLRIGLGGRRDRPGRIGNRDGRAGAGRGRDASPRRRPVLRGSGAGSAAARLDRAEACRPPIAFLPAGCRAPANRRRIRPSARIAISDSRSGPSIEGLPTSFTAGIDAIGAGQAKRPAIAGGQARNRRTRIKAERDADQRDAERRDQQARRIGPVSTPRTIRRPTSATSGRNSAEAGPNRNSKASLA